MNAELKKRLGRRRLMEVIVSVYRARTGDLQGFPPRVQEEDESILRFALEHWEVKPDPYKSRFSATTRALIEAALDLPLPAPVPPIEPVKAVRKRKTASESKKASTG